MKEFIEKVKVTSLQIIVTGCKNKPYFQIKYKEVGKEDYNIGYGSYDLNNVFNWKEDCFEIVNQLAEEYAKDTNVQTIDVTELVDVGNDGWIPCSERMPEPIDDMLQCVIVTDENDWQGMAYYHPQKGWLFAECHNSDRKIDWTEIIAWQPLPQPYQQKGE